MQRLSYGSHVGILCAASCARPASRRAECPQWCAAPYVAIRRMDRVRVLAQIVDVAGWHPPSTGPQPTFEPPSASSITNPSVVGPSVGSAAADPQPESWSEWAERLVQEQNAIVSMHHIPVLAGLGIYDLEGRPWGQSYEFCARVQEVRAAARLASTAPLWHSLSTEAQEATACIPGSNERASETPKRMHVRPRQTIASAR